MDKSEQQKDELARAADRAARLRYVAQLRHAFRDELDRPAISQEDARVRDCLDAGVPPYGEL